MNVLTTKKSKLTKKELTLQTMQTRGIRKDHQINTRKRQKPKFPTISIGYPIYNISIK
jgi:hypothetical protein